MFNCSIVAISIIKPCFIAFSAMIFKAMRHDYTPPHSEIVVKAPYNSDVIAIVRFNNMNGSVAEHRYIIAGNSIHNLPDEWFLFSDILLLWKRMVSR